MRKYFPIYWDLSSPPRLKTHSGFFVGLLDRVTRDVCVAVVFGRSPLQSRVEAPGVDDLHTGGRPRQLCDQHNKTTTRVTPTVFLNDI